MHWFFRGYSQKDFSQPSTIAPWREADLSDVDDEELTSENISPRRTYEYDLTSALIKRQQERKIERTQSAKRSGIFAVSIHWSANTASTDVKVYGKGTVRYKPRGSTSDGGENSQVECTGVYPSPRGFSPSPRPPYLVCRLRCDSLDPASLATLYGQQYTEGECLPRRFMVNVSWLFAMRTTEEIREKGGDVILVFCVGRKVNRRSWVTDENSSVVLQDAVISQYVR